MLRYWKWQDICAALVLAAGGCVMVMRPALTLEVMARAVGVLLMIVGLLFVLAFMLRRGGQIIGYDLILGIVITALGIFVCIQSDFVVGILPSIFGICITISGLLKLQRGFDVKRMGLDSWGYIIIMSLISILLGTIVILNPFGAAKWLMRVIGACFVYSGISDFITAVYVSWKYSHLIVSGKAELTADDQQTQAETGDAGSAREGAEGSGSDQSGAAPDGYYDPYEDGPQAWQGHPVDIWPDMEGGNVNGHDAGSAYPASYGVQEEVPLPDDRVLTEKDGQKNGWKLPFINR